MAWEKPYASLSPHRSASPLGLDAQCGYAVAVRCTLQRARPPTGTQRARKLGLVSCPLSIHNSFTMNILRVTDVTALSGRET
jgi:hypothetical protein